MLLSVFTQALSLGSLRDEMRACNAGWQRGFLPYAAGAFLGLPLGSKILARAPAHALVLSLGSLLVAYSLYSICKPIVGGFSAFPGSALVVWNGLKNVSKVEARALTQPFILVMQLIALAFLACSRPALFDARLWSLFAMAMPIAWVGNRAGLAIYKRASEVNFRMLTLAALGVSGLSLVLKGVLLA